MGKRIRTKEDKQRFANTRLRLSTLDDKILIELKARLAEDNNWLRLVMECDGRTGFRRLHLAVFVEPYLQYILDGTKTVESRFSVNFVSPHGRVNQGDVILLKRSSGPVVGVCTASKSWTYKLGAISLSEIEKMYVRQLRIDDPQFWKSRAKARYATLILLSNVKAIHPLPVKKTDRRGWVILSEPSRSTRALF